MKVPKKKEQLDFLGNPVGTVYEQAKADLPSNRLLKFTEAQEGPAGGNDAVTKPGHYQGNGMQAIDAIHAFLSPEEFRGYLRGNCLKYLIRAPKKGGVQDLAKAGWYLDRLSKAMKEAP